jgi:ABC-type lipoprotein release transport system permease subunit
MGAVRAVVFRLRTTLRRRWASTALIAVVVALAGGLVLTLAAGARRTSAAPDAYTAAVGGDVAATVQQRDGAPRTAEVTALPGVKTVSAITYIFATVVDPKHSDTNGAAFAGTRPPGSRLVAGHAANQANTHEFIADRGFVRTHHARLGSRFRIVSWTNQQLEQGQAYQAAPKGPSFTGVLVGIVQSPGELEDNINTIFFPTALLREDIAGVTTIMEVRLERGTSTRQLRSELDGLPDGAALSVTTGRVVSAEVRNAVEAQSRGTWLIAVVAAVASIVALGQLLSRHARLAERERRILLAIGSTRGSVIGESLLRAAVPAILGTIIGATGAILGSGAFPAGFVRALETDPGVRFDATVVVGGGLGLLAGMLAWVGVALITANPDRAQRSRTLRESVARRAPGPAAATGARFAFTGRDTSSSAVGTIVTIAAIVAGVAGATAFGTSLDRLVTDRGRFGANYTLAVGSLAGLPPAKLRTLLATDRDVAGVMILTESQARAGRLTVPITGVDRVQGDLAPRVLSGRSPGAADELALGRVTADELSLGVGDSVALDGLAGHGSYRVVGLVVVPGIGGNDGVGKGGVLTAAGLARINADTSSSMAAVQLRPGASTRGTQRRLARAGVDAGIESYPSAIVNVARVRRIPVLIALILAFLALLTTLHALIVSIRNRGRDLAVLRAIGADRRWIARVVHWQASVITALPLALGVPLGLVAGAALFRAFADSIGAWPSPVLPVLLIVGTLVALVAFANLAAIWPARRARRIAVAALLRDE